jgi:hypothetical protein
LLAAVSEPLAAGVTLAAQMGHKGAFRVASCRLPIPRAQFGVCEAPLAVRGCAVSLGGKAGCRGQLVS